jgi:hypothetical protein
MCFVMPLEAVARIDERHLICNRQRSQESQDAMGMHNARSPVSADLRQFPARGCHVARIERTHQVRCLTYRKTCIPNGSGEPALCSRDNSDRLGWKTGNKIVDMALDSPTIAGLHDVQHPRHPANRLLVLSSFVFA